MMEFTEQTFHIVDYIVFALMLLISAVVGIYYAVKDRRRQNTEEYLLAGRSMSAWPVSLSLAVSFMSAVTILGTPAEVYKYGLLYSWSVPAMCIVTVVTMEMFIPIFYKLKLGSVYEYLERRFNRAVRLESTILYMMQTFFYVGVVIYGPALALNAVTGLNLWAAVISTGIVCIFYSSIGGLKAVIWTDVFQALVMLVGLLSVVVMGCAAMGGYSNVWNLCNEGGRINFFRFNVDPRERTTTWSTFIGLTFLFFSIYAVNQGQVQRYLSCRSLHEAKKAILLNLVGSQILKLLVLTCGLIAYAYYKTCDPVSYGIISKADQIVPLLALNLFKRLPGMTGLFISCVYSGSLSTVSTAITAMASVTVEDYLRPHWKLKEKIYTYTSKCLVVFYGGLCILLAFVMSNVQGLVTAAVSVLSSVGGPLFGLYSLGLLCPFVNSVGAIVAINVGVGANVMVAILKIAFPPPPEFTQTLPFTTEFCDAEDIFNSSLSITTQESNTVAPEFSTQPPLRMANLNALSTFWYGPFGYLCTFVAGVTVSLLTGGWKERKNVDPRLIYYFFDHWIFNWVPDRFRKAMRYGMKQVDDEEEKKEADEEAKTSFLMM